MSFIDEIKEKARKSMKTIVLPESTDIRVLEAARKVTDYGFAKVVLIGNREELQQIAGNIDISDIEIVDPATSPKTEEYVQTFYELRKAKGMTEEKARETMKDNIYYATMMIKQGDADGLVSGSVCSTADTLRPSLQIVKTAPGVKLVSSFFVMQVPNCEYGENGLFLFSDCGLNVNPNSEELAEIAISSANTWKQLFGTEPRVAMLSYSTFGSAPLVPMTEKVIEATKIVKEKCPDLLVDGEMQLDASIVPSVGAKKAPESKVAGKANILIFPDLNAGNIGYKLVERLAKAEAYGPVTQGIAKPVNDLSRGCKADDIVGVVAITAVQAENM
ncbi:MAG: phosphate acetyltransferase [Clostridia bacterium]|nr:phosphate acetyltransferase [Clostridia bacterium]